MCMFLRISCMTCRREFRMVIQLFWGFLWPSWLLFWRFVSGFNLKKWNSNKNIWLILNKIGLFFPYIGPFGKNIEYCIQSVVPLTSLSKSITRNCKTKVHTPVGVSSLQTSDRFLQWAETSWHFLFYLSVILACRSGSNKRRDVLLLGLCDSGKTLLYSQVGHQI